MSGMRPNFSLILVAIITLAVCNQVVRPSDQNIRTPQTTNDISTANLNLGIAYLKEGNYNNALDKLGKARAADPGYSPTYNVLSLLYQQPGDKDTVSSYALLLKNSFPDSEETS